MLSVKTWIYGKLSGLPNLVYSFPNDFSVFPIVCYQEVNQSSKDYFDNTTESFDSTIQIDVWTGDGISTTALSLQVSTIMEGLLYNLDMSMDTPEPDLKVQHKVMRFSRSLVAEDLV